MFLVMVGIIIFAICDKKIHEAERKRKHPIQPIPVQQNVDNFSGSAEQQSIDEYNRARAEDAKENRGGGW